MLQAGEQLALDGDVIRGHGQADLSMLTGEHLPQSLGPGAELLAGCQLVEGELELAVTAGIAQPQDHPATADRPYCPHPATRYCDRCRAGRGAGAVSGCTGPGGCCPRA